MLLYRESFWFLGGMDFIVVVVVGFLCFCFGFLCNVWQKKQKKKKDQNLSYGVIVGRSKLMRWVVNLICEGEREREGKRER